MIDWVLNHSKNPILAWHHKKMGNEKANQMSIHTCPVFITEVHGEGGQTDFGDTIIIDRSFVMKYEWSLHYGCRDDNGPRCKSRY
jgi:hypothetical protein